jgi:DNA modification methylase
MARVDIKNTELVWPGKYDNEGKLKPVERSGPYPFQRVEVINAPRIGRGGKHEQITLYDIWKGDEGETFEEGWQNKLIWGDNKLVMASLLEKFVGKIDLIYIDPPFATGADFKFRTHIGEEGKEITKEHSMLEQKAYNDTWGRGLDSYLPMMHDRLVLMHQLLSKKGVIYVHLDWHAGHYVKIMMDEIFGPSNFLNEVIWHFRTGNIAERIFARRHESLMLYSKSDEYTFNPIEIKEYYKAVYGPDFEPSFKGRKHSSDEFGDYRVVFVDDVWDLSAVFTLSKEHLYFDTQKPEQLLKRIVLASSNPGDLVADFFCGSGTTLAVAEKLGRRWVGCDLSRYAIHLTRKRLLEIESSKDLENEKTSYGKKARPFEILNLGRYERQLWRMTTFNHKDEKQTLYEYLAFMLRLYGAEPIAGFNNIHGKKGSALVYVGAVDSPVTIQEILDSMKDCKSVGCGELHVLGWEWEMGLNDAIQEMASREGMKLKLRIVPNEVLDKRAVEKGDVRFFELAYFKVEINGKIPQNGKAKISGRNVVLKLKDFVIPHTDLVPQDVKDRIKEWRDWVDYWAVDFNFQNDTFNNGWVSYRTPRSRSINLAAGPFVYKELGNYKIFVKVIDIFGIDTSQIFEIEVVQ